MIKFKGFRKLVCALMCMTLTCGFIGCGSSEKVSQQSNNKQDEQSSKVLKIAVGAELNTLYPLNMDVQNNIATKLCYEGLVNYVDGKVVPGLAESWEFTNEGKDLTFHLKKGVKFHDGSDFNAESVKANFEFGMNNKNFSAIKAVANLKSIEVVDENTVTFHYPNAYFAYLTDFCYPGVMILVSPNVIEEGNYQSMSGVVGTGAYIYDEIVNGDHVKFVRNKDYWGEKPYYDEVIVKYIPESSARLQALQNGEIDMIYGSALLTWDDYKQATSLNNVKGVVSDYDSNTRNIILNASSNNLNDIKVREAVAYAIDKKSLSEGLSLGYESEATKLFPEGIPYTNGKLNIERNFDLDKAKSLLDEAGWKVNDSTKIREKDGNKLSLNFTYDSGSVINQNLATVIKSQLAQVGIDVTTTGQDMMTWWKEGFAGHYDITIWNTEEPYTSPHNYFTPMLNRSAHVPSLGGLKDTTQFNNYINEFQTTDNEERVQEIFDYLLNFDNDNVIDIPLLYAKDMVVFNSDKISNYTFTSTPTFFDITKVAPVE